MNSRFDYAIIDAINNAIRSVKASPLVLGATASGGGGPVGGIIGYLTQSRVSYDSIEAETPSTPASGMSILDNLNHIRYRLGVVEASGVAGSGNFLDLTDTPDSYTGSSGKAVIVNPTEDGLEFGTVAGGVNILSSGIVVVSGVTDLDFYGADITSSGLTAFITVSGSMPILESGRVALTNELGELTTTPNIYWDSLYERLFLGGPAVVDSSFLPDAAKLNIFPHNGPDQEPNGQAIATITNWGSSAVSPIFASFRALGTYSAPEAVTSGTPLFSLAAYAYDGSTWAGSLGRIRFVSTADHSTGDHGTSIQIDGVPRGSTSRENYVTIDETGLNIPAGKQYMIDGVPVGGAGGGNGFQLDSSSGVSTTYGAITGDIDGVNTEFTVSHGSYTSGSLQVYLNGQLLTQGNTEDWTELDISTGTFSMIYPPVADDVLVAFYKYSDVSSGNADTLDGYEASAFITRAEMDRGSVLVDFSFMGDINKIVTVTNSTVLDTSSIMLTVSAMATDNNTSDDILYQELEVKVCNKAAGSFDVYVNSLCGLFNNEVYIDYVIIN